MEHSAAIMEDAGRLIDEAAKQANDVPASGSTNTETIDRESSRGNNDSSRKRKGDWGNASSRRGGKSDRSKPARDNKRHKKGDMGRSEYFEIESDKRAKTASSAQRRKEAGDGGPSYGPTFSQEEIASEERRPKRKVAVLIGYAGTGYKGMQISPSEKTIEGDIFRAFVDAGAISKANADDPKKAGLVRCARTDKGVHAAGNMISLKLIVEDKSIVEKINEHLPPQIRIWGIERTIGSFSCYQACDSRWYEYLIPSHAFLPPHPSSWLAKQLEQLAEEAGDKEEYEARQAEVKGYWEKVDEEFIKPVLETIDDDIRWEVIKALQGEEEASAKTEKVDVDVDVPGGKSGEVEDADENSDLVHDTKSTNTEATTTITTDSASNAETTAQASSMEPAEPNGQLETSISSVDATEASKTSTEDALGASDGAKANPSPEELDRVLRLRAATKTLRLAYATAKRRYRIPEKRIDRVQAALDKYVGTKNYHNYTVQKTFRDPSAKRNIKSFVINRSPILIGDGDNDDDKSQWLSMKVHGQSFMMHQIRKMIGMITLLVRCGSDLSTMDASFKDERFSIPKVPGLGLMLERPVFDSYNNLQAAKHDRPQLNFGKWEEEINAFKHKEIYARMFREEEERGEFGRFFNHVDNFKEGCFLWVSSKGLEATKNVKRSAVIGEKEDGVVDTETMA